MAEGGGDLLRLERGDRETADETDIPFGQEGMELIDVCIHGLSRRLEMRQLKKVAEIFGKIPKGWVCLGLRSLGRFLFSEPLKH
jgi:hypothetical protein